MTYNWRCNACGEIVEVTRSMHDCLRGPEGDEAKHSCPGTDFKKIPMAPRHIYIIETETD
jgi:rubredoxin